MYLDKVGVGLVIVDVSPVDDFPLLRLHPDMAGSVGAPELIEQEERDETRLQLNSI